MSKSAFWNRWFLVGFSDGYGIPLQVSWGPSVGTTSFFSNFSPSSKLHWTCSSGNIQGSKRPRGSMQGLLMLRLRTGPLSFQSYSTGQSKSQATEPVQIQEVLKWMLILDGRSEESHSREHGYREAETAAGIFIINLPDDILFKLYIMPKSLCLDTIFWETSFSCKVAMVQLKYRRRSSKPSFHGLLFTTYARHFCCQIFTWLFPSAALCSNCAPHTYLVSKTEGAGSKDLLQHSSFIYSGFQSCLVSSFLSLGEPLSWH